MLGVHFLGQGKISLDELPMPQPCGRWVVIQTRSATICGTDRENLMGAGQKTVPGHESAGVVFAVDQPMRLKPGDRVAINCHVTCGHCEHCLRGDLYFCNQLTIMGFDYDGGFAEYMSVPEASCMPVPDDISFEQASLIVDMLGTPFRAVKRAHLIPGQKIAIWGAGPIGLGALMCAKRFGVEVALIELSSYRREMACGFGPDVVIDPGQVNVSQALKKWTDGKGIDVGFDCVGNEAVCQQALTSIKRRGTLAVVGVSHQLTLNPWEQLIMNETTIYGSRNFNTAEFDEMIGLIHTGLPVDKVITHRFTYLQAEEAFQTFREGQCGKVIFVGSALGG